MRETNRTNLTTFDSAVNIIPQESITCDLSKQQVLQGAAVILFFPVRLVPSNGHSIGPLHRGLFPHNCTGGKHPENTGLYCCSMLYPTTLSQRCSGNLHSHIWPMLEQSDWHVMLLNQVHLDAGQMWGWTGASHVAYRFTYHVVLTDSVWMDLEGELLSF